MAEISSNHAPFSLLDLIRSDVTAWADIWLPEGAYRRRAPGLFVALRLLWQHLGLRAALLYRVSHRLQRKKVRILPQMLSHLNVTLHGFDVPASVEIGPRLYIPHPVGTVIMAERIGHSVTLVSSVTIGMRHGPVFPRIGNNVYIGAGARILGAITIGDNVSIGANAVVLTDVPRDSIAVGVPARIQPAQGETVSSHARAVGDPTAVRG